MNLSPNVVAKVIKGWSMIFPGNKTPEELAFISAKFCKSLSTVYNDHTFQIAAEMIEKETEFFPTIKGMMDVRNSAYQVRDRDLIDNNIKMIPEETKLTEEEKTINLGKIHIIKDMLAGKYSISEAIEKQEKIKNYVADR